MKVKIIISTSAFLLTFIISIANNIFFTAIKRGILAFILFYIFASIIVKALEKEINLFHKQTKDLPDNHDTHENNANENNESVEQDNVISDDNNINSADFNKIDFEKIDTNNIDNMDPAMVANILKSFQDDKPTT